MPEYSSTTITPADNVQTPAMNGNTSGNYTLEDLRTFILASKGLANGLASLDGNGKLNPSQLPDLADDVIVVASYAVLPATGTAGKIYITADNNKMYRWDPDLVTPGYVNLSVDLSIYATKEELSAEETSRRNADSDLQNNIDTLGSDVSILDERVDSLEQAAVSGYHYKGDCTYANLPSSGQQLGDMWYVTDRNMNYIWNGTTWRPADNIGWNWVLQADGNYKLGILEK